MYTDTGDYRSLAQEELLGEPHSGDFDMGGGVSTSQLQNPNVSLASTRGSGATGGLSSGPGVWFVVIAILIVIEWIRRKGGGRGEEVRVGLSNLFVTTGLVAIGFFGLKIAAAKAPAGPVGGAFKQFVGTI